MSFFQLSAIFCFTVMQFILMLSAYGVFDLFNRELIDYPLCLMLIHLYTIPAFWISVIAMAYALYSLYVAVLLFFNFEPYIIQWFASLIGEDVWLFAGVWGVYDMCVFLCGFIMCIFIMPKTIFITVKSLILLLLRPLEYKQRFKDIALAWD